MCHYGISAHYYQGFSSCWKGLSQCHSGLTFKGKELLSPYSTLRKVKTKVQPPMRPGMRADFEYPYHYFTETDRGPYKTRISMVAEAGIDNESAHSKQDYEKSITLQPKNRVEISLRGKQRAAGLQYEKTNVKTQSDYLVGTTPDAFSVEVKRIQGWEKVYVTTPGGVNELRAIQGIRITFPDQGCVMDNMFDRPITNGHLGYHPDKGVLCMTLLIPYVKLSSREMTTVFSSTLTLHDASAAPPPATTLEDPLGDW